MSVIRLIRSRVFIAAFLMLCLAAAAALTLGVDRLRARQAVAGWQERTPPRQIQGTTLAEVQQAFAGPSAPQRSAYHALARHFLEGFLAYRSPTGAAVLPPGLPGEHGIVVEGLEGFARYSVLAGAWLEAGGADALPAPPGARPASLADAMRQGVLAGTDPDGPGYWHAAGNYDQRIVEAADVALGLWLSRERVWARLDAAQRRQVARWLGTVVEAMPHEGVWQLFPLLVARTLGALGEPVGGLLDERMRTNYELYKSRYRGEGWFQDSGGQADFYNAWGAHYALFWIDRIDPAWDRAFLHDALGRFAGFYKHLFGPAGHPVMGRSVCYRMAAPAPLLAAAWLRPDAISAGEAVRTLDATWQHYLARGAVADGTVTQGLCQAEPSALEGYVGRGSCLWSLRSLIMALYVDHQTGLLAVARSPLPVERGDFAVTSEGAGWRITGHRQSGEIRLEILANGDGEGPAWQPIGRHRPVIEWLLHRASRPDNRPALYQRRVYSNLAPVVPGCSAS